ncbi:MAG TPA: hypothetical protein VGQ42_11230 [Candidatus Dormibacteraeota bacterium]|jgi:hypothetical protein|nr:hypothetical protein [Candidatus Dormibacteraeota bacterium]
MLFTPLRKAIIAGAGVVALGAGAGVATHSAASTTLTAATSTAGSTPAPSASPGAKHHGARAGNPRGLLGLLIQVTASKTGLTQQQVMDDLKAGQSIDQIAGSKAADIKATVLAQEQQKLSTSLDTIMGQKGLPSHKGPKGATGTPSPSPGV